MNDPEEEEEFDYENDDSWYEDAMNQLDSPSNNHHIIYSEEEIKELTDYDKTIIRYRNHLLENGFEYVELKNGDYIQEIVSRSGVIHIALCSFVLMYKKHKSYVAIFQVDSKDEAVQFPIQIASMAFVEKHLGCYQFVEFFHLEEELPEDQKDLNGITINRDLTYNDKPSFQFYKSDNEELNKKYIERLLPLDPRVFEFVNEYVIVELKEEKKMEEYLGLIQEFEA
jgi:hypothetical protein